MSWVKINEALSEAAMQAEVTTFTVLDQRVLWWSLWVIPELEDKLGIQTLEKKKTFILYMYVLNLIMNGSLVYGMFLLLLLLRLVQPCYEYSRIHKGI